MGGECLRGICLRSFVWGEPSRGNNFLRTKSFEEHMLGGNVRGTKVVAEKTISGNKMVEELFVPKQSFPQDLFPRILFLKTFCFLIFPRTNVFPQKLVRLRMIIKLASYACKQ